MILLSVALVAPIATMPMAAAQVAPRATPNADRLADRMRVLARDPENLDALAEAGELSVRLGDPAAALAFFSRGEAIAPGNARLMAGRAAALTALERPGEALRLFQAAERAGFPVARMAAQRGLAFDLLGQPAHAQSDYRLALRDGPDAEVTRRLALSLGISGDVAESTRVLDPLLRQNDRAAWRTRAFVLAINGDAAGAERIAAGLLPGFGPSLSPFFRRIASLDAAGRAFAVHFGQLSPTPARLADAAMSPAIPPLDGEPRRGRTTEVASDNRSSRPRAAERRGSALSVATAPVDTPTQPLVSRPLVAAAPSATGSIAAALRRRAQSGTTRPPVPGRVAPPFTVRAASAAPNEATQVPTPPPPPVAVASVPPQAPARGAPPPATPAAAASLPAADSADNRAILGAIVARLTAEAASSPPSAPPPAATQPVAPEPVARAQSAPPVPRAAPVKARSAPVKAAPAKPDPAKLEPARHWVQVAGGANKGDLPKVWDRLVKDAPDAFKGKQGWTTPLRATNRLLAGPFRTAREAQAFVNLLGKSGLSAFAWESEAGQKIERLRTR